MERRAAVGERVGGETGETVVVGELVRYIGWDIDSKGARKDEAFVG